MQGIHYIQLKIIRYLGLNPGAKFNELFDPTVATNVYAYHLKTLISEELVIKDTESRYHLTSKGKKMFNTLNVRNQIPSQNIEPKVSVKCHIFEGATTNSRILAQKRLKAPYYGFVGAVTGSVEYGKTLSENASNACIEKTNLKPGSMEYVGVAQVQNFNNSEELLDDKIFHLFNIFQPKGKLKLQGEGYENKWMDTEEYMGIEMIHYGEKEIMKQLITGSKSNFLELKNSIETF